MSSNPYDIEAQKAVDDKAAGANPYEDEVGRAERARQRILEERARHVKARRDEQLQRMVTVNRLLKDLAEPEFLLLKQALEGHLKTVDLRFILGNEEKGLVTDPRLSLTVTVMTERIVQGPTVWITSQGRFEEVTIAYTTRAQKPNNFGEVFPDYAEKVRVEVLDRSRVESVLRAFVGSYFR